MSGKLSGYLQLMTLPPPVTKAILHELFVIVLYFREVHGPRLVLATVLVTKSTGSGNVATVRIQSGRMAKFLTVEGPRGHLFF